MARNQFDGLAQDKEGNALAGCPIFVFAGHSSPPPVGSANPTGTPITGSAYLADSGGVALTNPMTVSDANGEFTLWFDTPQEVDFGWTDGGGTATLAKTGAFVTFPTRVKTIDIKPGTATIAADLAAVIALIPPVPTYNAKGDIQVATAPGVASPLAVGANGTVPIADSSQGHGMRWGSLAGITPRPTNAMLLVDSSNIGGDSAPLAQRGSIESPYETLHQCLLDIGMNGSGVILNFHGTIVLVGGSSGAAVEFPTGFAGTVTWQGCQGMSIIGSGFNAGNGQGSCLISGTAVAAEVFKFMACENMHLENFTIMNYSATGHGARWDGASVNQGNINRVGVVAQNPSAGWSSGTGFIVQGDAQDGLCFNHCYVVYMGYGWYVQDNGVHAVNRVAVVDSRAENCNSAGARIGTTLQVTGASIGGHQIVFDRFAVQGSANPPSIAGILIEGTCGVRISHYSEIGPHADQPDVMIRCRTGGSASDPNDWAQDIVIEKYFEHKIASQSQLTTWTPSLHLAQWVDADSVIGLRVHTGHAQGSSVANIPPGLGFDPDLDELPNYPMVRFRTNTRDCEYQGQNVYAEDSRALVSRPPHRDMVVQDDNGWVHNRFSWYDPKGDRLKTGGGWNQPNGSTPFIYANGAGAPTACTAAQGVQQGGTVDVGTHSYRVVYLLEGGKSAQGPKSNVVTIVTNAHKVNLTAIPVSGDARCYARMLYRTVAGDGGSHKFCGFLWDNTSTTFTDATPDASLGPAIIAAGTIDLQSARVFSVVATDGTALTMPTPVYLVSGQRVVIDVKNTSGGAMGAVTWPGVFLMPAWTKPGNGLRTTTEFYCDGVNLIQVGNQSTAF